jgi:hypothetical protein
VKHAFLTAGQDQKSLKGIVVGKHGVLCPKGPHGSNSHMREIRRGLCWKQMDLSYGCSPTNFLLKGWKPQVPVTYLAERNATGDRSTDFSPSRKLKSGCFNCAQRFLNKLLQQSDVHLGTLNLEDKMSDLFQAHISVAGKAPIVTSTLEKTEPHAIPGFILGSRTEQPQTLA